MEGRVERLQRRATARGYGETDSRLRTPHLRPPPSATSVRAEDTKSFRRDLWKTYEGSFRGVVGGVGRAKRDGQKGEGVEYQDEGP